MNERKPEMDHSSPVSQIVSIIQEADQAIEEWFHHVIDQIEDENYNQSNQTE